MLFWREGEPVDTSCPALHFFAPCETGAPSAPFTFFTRIAQSISGFSPNNLFPTAVSHRLDGVVWARNWCLFSRLSSTRYADTYNFTGSSNRTWSQDLVDTVACPPDLLRLCREFRWHSWTRTSFPAAPFAVFILFRTCLSPSGRLLVIIFERTTYGCWAIPYGRR